MGTQKAYLGLFVFLCSTSCGINVYNTRQCSVAGYISNGMDCAYTLSDKTEQMNFHDSLIFLEPQVERPDPNDPSKTLPARGGAICQSSEDWGKNKTSLEQACKKLSGCNYEQLHDALERINSVSRKRE